MTRARWGALVVVLVAAIGAWLWSRGGPARGKEGGRRSGKTTASSGSAGGDAAGGLGVGHRGDIDRSGVGRVRGRVVDEDGSPVTEGRVILHCAAPGSDQSVPIEEGAVEIGPEGEFTGPGCRGIVCAELRHPSLLPRDPWVLEVGEEPSTLVARPLERSVGAVIDPQGQPVAGAMVAVRRGGDEDDPAALPPFTSRNTVTDGEGFFSFARVERPPCDPCGEASGRCEPGDARDVPTYGSLVLVARAPGFRSTEKTVEIGEDDAWQIVLQPPLGPLRGALTDAFGRAYPRARVLARSQPRGYEIHHARVEGAQFSLSELGEGRYDLRAVQDGVELAASLGHVAGETIELIGTVPATGRGVTLEVVLRGTDEPVVGAVVDGGPFMGARTDASGVVHASEVLPGTYVLGIRVPGLRSQRGSLTVGAGEEPMSERVEVAR